MIRVSLAQALSFRMRRHLLDPVGTDSVEDVVRRLCGIQAQVASSAELAIRTRQQRSTPGEVAAAIADGRLVKTWAMRGTLHLLTPEDAGIYLSLLAAGRSWERPSWQRAFGMTTELWERFRLAVRDALGEGTLSREELVAAVVAAPGLEHIGQELRSGWGSLLKPLAWQGDLVFGPARGNRVTFVRPAVASSRWGGVPGPDEAGPKAILAYLGAHGPATADGFANWLSRGRVPKRDLRRWFDAARGDLVEVDVGGKLAFALAEHADDLAATKPSAAIRLAAAFDQWVLGPGTDDRHVVPAHRRAAVSRQSGWIAPVVVAAGPVPGTWELDGDVVRVQWFADAGNPPKAALAAEAERLGEIVGRDLSLEIAAV